MAIGTYDPNLARATFFFKVNDFGWSETFYANAPGAPGIGGLALGAVTLCNRRLRMMTSQVKCQGVRLSRPSKFRDTRFIVPLTNYAGFIPPVLSPNTLLPNGTFATLTSNPTSPANDTPVEPGIGLLFRLEAGTGARRLFIARGIPETLVTGSTPGTQNVYNFNANGWPAVLGAFKNSLLGLDTPGTNWRIPALDEGQPILPVKDVLTGSSGNGITLSLNPAFAGPPQKQAAVGGPMTDLAVGDYVRVRGVKGCHAVNGYWKVASITPPALPLGWGIQCTGTAGRLPVVPSNAVFTAAIAQYLLYAGGQIDSVGDERIDSRNTGRPFGQHRGRRPRRL